MADQRYDDYYRGSSYAPPPGSARQNSTAYAPDAQRFSPPPRTEYSARPNEYNAMAPYNDETARYQTERQHERADYDYNRQQSRAGPPRDYDPRDYARDDYGRDDRRRDDYRRDDYDDRYSRDSYDDEPPRRHHRERSHGAARSRSRGANRSRSRSRGFLSNARDEWDRKPKEEKKEDLIAGVIGAGAGGFLGNKFAGGKIGTIGGAVIGGIAAEELERHREKKKRAKALEEEMRHGGRPGYDSREYSRDSRDDREPRGRGYDDYDDYDDRPPPRRSRSRSIVDRVKRSLSRSRSRGPRRDFYDD